VNESEKVKNRKNMIKGRDELKKENSEEQKEKGNMVIHEM
jgi:hypothetical protein